MNIQAEKLEIMKLILDTDNPSLLASVKSLFTREAKKDFWANLSQEQKIRNLNWHRRYGKRSGMRF